MIDFDAALSAARFALCCERQGGSSLFLSSRPELVRSLSGAPAFYLFFAEDPFGLQAPLHIWIAADESFGAPIFATVLGTTLNFESIANTAKKALVKEHPNSLVLDWNVVVYKYPRIGILLTYIDTLTGVGDNEIYDVYIDKFIDRNATSEENKIYDIVVQNRQKYGKLDYFGGGFKAGSWADQLNFYRAYSDKLGPADAGEPVPTSQRTLFSAVNKNEGDFPLVPQIDETHCAIASAEMISKYFGIVGDQKSLEASFNYQAGLGTTTDDQVIGYDNLLAAVHLDADIDFTPTFLDASREIDDGRPLRSAVKGHARCCCGYRQRSLTLQDGTSIQVADLLIHDPYPPNIGQVRWETIATAQLTNFIYFKTKN